MEARVSVPVTRIEKIEHVADVVAPAVLVERGGVALADGIEPARVLLGVDRAHRQGGGWEEILRRLAVEVDEDLRVPLLERIGDCPALGLRQAEAVAVEVDLVVVVVGAHPPRRIVLQGGRVGVAHHEGVVPGGVALVALRIMGEVDQHEHAVAHALRPLVVAGGKLVGKLNRRLERRRLVPVVCRVQPDYNRQALHHRRCILHGRPARIGEALQIRLDGVQTSDDVFAGDRHEVHRPLLDAPSVVEDAHALRHRLG